MRTGTQIALLHLVETLVRALVGLLLGGIGCIVVLSAVYQVGSVNFRFLSGSGVVCIVTLVVGGALLWFAGRLLNGLTRRAPSA